MAEEFDVCAFRHIAWKTPRSCERRALSKEKEVLAPFKTKASGVNSTNTKSDHSVPKLFEELKQKLLNILDVSQIFNSRLWC